MKRDSRPMNTNTNQYTTHHTQNTNTNKTPTHNTHSPAIKAHSLERTEVRYSDLTLQRHYPHTHSHRTEVTPPYTHTMTRYTQPPTIKAHGLGVGVDRNYSGANTTSTYTNTTPQHTHKSYIGYFPTTKARRREGGGNQKFFPNYQST